MRIFSLKYFSSLFRKITFASSRLKQIYKCPYMLLYISKEHGVSFVKFHQGLARSSRVRGPSLRSEVQGPVLGSMVSGSCLRVRDPGSYLRIRSSRSWLRVRGPTFPVCPFKVVTNNITLFQEFCLWLKLDQILW